MELNEQEAHCVARLLQGALFGEHNLLDGCNYCKFQCRDERGHLTKLRAIRKRLTEETGVDLDVYLLDWDLAKFDHPYCKFLANANAEARAYFGINNERQSVR